MLGLAAFKGVISGAKGLVNVIVNTHATFRWRHGLFSAIDFESSRCDSKPQVEGVYAQCKHSKSVCLHAVTSVPTQQMTCSSR